MTKRSRVANKMAEKFPDFIPIKGGIFVRRKFDHILSGYSLEYTPSGAWIWRVVYPLFDRSDTGIHLTYSHRLPESLGHISGLKFSRDEMIDEFVTRVSEFDKTVPAMYSIQDFCDYCEKDAGIVRNKYTALGLGYAFALTGKKDKASSYLKYSIPKLGDPYAIEAREVLERLGSEPERAVEIINSFEKEMRLTLRLN